MVQIDFDTVTQIKRSIALNHFPEYAQDHLSFKVVPTA